MGIKTSTSIILVVVAVIVVIGGSIDGVAIYRDQIAPFRATVLVVDDASISMRYFLKRVLMSGTEPMAMLQTLVKEQIVKQVAIAPPYNIKLSKGDVDQFLRELAQGDSNSMSDNDFKEWYRQQLNESRLSNSEFRDLAGTNLLMQRLIEQLAQRIPSVAEQVHLLMIVSGNFEDAKRIKGKLDTGEQFAKVAREVSSDEDSKSNGGDLGWFPRDALAPNVAEAVFDKLKVGQASEPLYFDEQHFVIVEASEKATDRKVSAESLQRIKTKVLNTWVNEQYRYHKVELRGLKNGYDSETDAWVGRQLQKMKSPR